MGLADAVFESRLPNSEEILEKVAERVRSQYDNGLQLDLDDVLGGNNFDDGMDYHFNDKRDAVMACFVAAYYSGLVMEDDDETAFQRGIRTYMGSAKFEYGVITFFIGATGGAVLTGSFLGGFLGALLGVLGGHIWWGREESLRKIASAYANNPYRRKGESFNPDKLIIETARKLTMDDAYVKEAYGKS
ncbi:hypothetical protein KY361_06090 [Candidatus Woesearchaeota archaeon]|nr:hypothetical protein [Candidatus Woesearchaeota archaeon]